MLEILEKDKIEKKEDMIGLSSEEAKRRQKLYGKNQLEKPKKPNALKIFGNQFKDILVLILLGATVVSVLVGEVYDAFTIIVIVALNSIIGFIQEFRTERTLMSLEKLASPTAKVYRDGKILKIPSEDIVIGDVFEVETGDRIPCDAYIKEQNFLSCDESVLTGESKLVSKKQRTNENFFNDLNLSYMLYMGGVVTRGNAVAEATSIGRETQMGRVGSMLHSIDSGETPLQVKLKSLSKVLAIICMAICVVVTAAGIIRGENVFTMLMTGLTVSIAAIPEGLPAAVTIALALAVSRMLKQNALVRKLHSVETLGSATVICTDKTGTLTENKMKVSQLSTVENDFEVRESKGGEAIFLKNESIKAEPVALPSLHEMLRCGVACNNSKVSIKEELIGGNSRNRGNIRKTYETSGDPVEAAMKLVGMSVGITSEVEEFSRIFEEPFESEKRKMTVKVSDKTGLEIEYTKGALDVILDKCDYYFEGRELKRLSLSEIKEIERKRDEMSKEGLRVIAFSEVLGEKNIFLGIMGLLDPLRPEIKRSIALCKRAKIKVIMLTGDHKLTACEIAKKAGIIKSEEEALKGSEIDEMDDEELSLAMKKVRVLSRVSPSHKLRIVRILKEAGEIVAMTGDGVNDAPAIKEASVGIAMGSGTDVTKSVSDITLLDDNFKTIVMSVKNGRGIFLNIRKFVRYLLSCNIGEVCVMFIGILMGLPIVLLPAQILLVNLVTDGLPAVALGLEPIDDDILHKPPRRPDENFFSGGLLTKILFRGIFIGLCTLASFVIALALGEGEPTARTCALFTLVLSQLIHVFECKSEEKTLLKIKLFNNLFLVFSVLASMIVLVMVIYMHSLSVIFSAVPLSLKMLLISILCSVMVPILSVAADKISN